MADQASKTDQAGGRSATARRSRRQLLAGGTGALAAVLAAEALARPAPAAAANGDNVILGQANTETGTTEITNSTAGRVALTCVATGAGVGVAGTSDRGIGVEGGCTSGDGVYGASGSGNGVHGATDSLFGVGVLGENQHGGTAVGGVSTSGDGVGGTSASGNGVDGRAISAAGTGVLAENTAGEIALKVAGKAVFSRSGVLTVPARRSSAVRTGIALTRASLVLATIQGNVAGVHVQGVTVVPGAPGSFTIHLNKAVPARTKVAWFALN